MAFIEGVADCGADLWRCGIYIYFVLRIRVAEIKEILSVRYAAIQIVCIWQDT